MICALNDVRSRTIGLNVGASCFLIKPLDRAELRARIAELLASKPSTDAADEASGDRRQERR